MAESEEELKSLLMKVKVPSPSPTKSRRLFYMTLILSLLSVYVFICLHVLFLKNTEFCQKFFLHLALIDPAITLLFNHMI